MKLAIFDLDGVLVDTSHIHTLAFQQAVGRVVDEAKDDPILNAADGVRTVDKLKMIKDRFNLSDEQIELIDRTKQELTIDALRSLKTNEIAVEVMRTLAATGYTLAVGSNSRRAYVDLILRAIGVESFISYSVAGDEVDKPKPNEEIFVRVMKHFNVEPTATVIFEDSAVGLEAARRSGAKVIQVNPSKLITMENAKGA